MKTIGRWMLLWGLAMAMWGCRQQDIRTFRIRLHGVEGTNDLERIRLVLARLDGVRADQIRFPAPDEVEVTYDSMKLARKNLEYAIAGAGYGANDIPAGCVPEGKRTVSSP